MIYLGLWACGLLVVIWPGRVYAQISAKLESISGEVQVSIRGGVPSLAVTGVVLNAGDTIRTGPGSEATLRLPDGSTLQLGENSSLDISTLAQNPQTGARTSFFKLFFGKVRAIISEDYKRTPGAEFNIETPNALAGVKFTIFTVAYDPVKDETEVSTEVGEVILTVLRRLDCPPVSLQAGNTGIIQGTECSSIFRTGERPEKPEERPLPEEQPPPPLPGQPSGPGPQKLLDNFRDRTSANTSSSTPNSPMGGINTPQTSSPPPSNQRVNPDRQVVPVRVIIEVQKTHKK